MARAPLDRAPGAAEQTHPVAGGDREIIGVAVLVDSPVDDLVIADFAAALQPFADRAADLGHIVVGRRADCDPVLRVARPQHIAPRDIKFGDAADHLVAVPADQHGVAVLPLHCQRLGGLAFAKQPRDLAAAAGNLTHRGQQLGQGFRGQRATQDFDRIAGLDSLRLLAVA